MLQAPCTPLSELSGAVARLAREEVDGVEETLVPAAEVLDPGRMRMLTAFTRHRLDADGALEADNRDHERRWFACDQVFGGAFVLRGELDAENGAVLKTALDALSSPSGPDDQRRGSQRRADALVELASRQLRDGRLPAGVEWCRRGRRRMAPTSGAAVAAPTPALPLVHGDEGVDIEGRPVDSGTIHWCLLLTARCRRLKGCCHPVFQPLA